MKRGSEYGSLCQQVRYRVAARAFHQLKAGATEVTGAIGVIEIRSKNLRQTIEEDLEGASLSSIKLIHMKFRFTIEVEGKPEDVTFVITPPYATDLPKKKHAETIAAYLQENGVQLG